MIVGITGLIGSGKDTIAEYLITQHGFKKLSFAASLKDAVAAVFGWDRTLLEGTTPEGRVWREQVDQWWAKKLNMPNLTPRWVLQYWGTEVCRHGFHNDIWVASLENQLRQTKNDVVITDCRFINELDAIKNAGGVTVRVSRGPDPEWYTDAIAYNSGPHNMGWALSRDRLQKSGIHASEYSSVGLAYDYIVDNNGTLVDLHNKIEKIVSASGQPSSLLDANLLVSS
jgi:hypothetical protein